MIAYFCIQNFLYEFKSEIQLSIYIYGEKVNSVSYYLRENVQRPDLIEYELIMNLLAN